MRPLVRKLPSISAKSVPLCYLDNGSLSSLGFTTGAIDSLKAILSIQTRLASALAQAVVAQLTAADRASLAQQATASPDALASFWRGKALLERRDIHALRTRMRRAAKRCGFATRTPATPRTRRPPSKPTTPR